MKILYAIQATGNGHISRALQLRSALENFGQVDYFLSGNNYHLNVDLPIKYRSKGISLYCTPKGKIDIFKTVVEFLKNKARKEAMELPIEKYDLVINDFEPITSIACAIKKVHSVNVSHQASFLSENTPRPEWRSVVGEYILKNFAPASDYIGLHFKEYDRFITTPIIKNSVLQAEPVNGNEIVIYLPQYSLETIIASLRNHEKYNFIIFTGDVNHFVQYGKIKVYPVNNQYFTECMIHCHGVITAGGFETPSEALYMRKRLISIPIAGQYEQQCNTLALRKEWNILVLKSLKQLNFNMFTNWYNSGPPAQLQTTNSPEKLAALIVSKKY